MEASTEQSSLQTSNALKLKLSDSASSTVQFHSPPVVPPLSLSSAIFNSNRVASAGPADIRSAARGQQYVGSNFSDEFRPDDPTRVVRVAASPSRSDVVDASRYGQGSTPSARHQSVGEIVGSPALSDYRSAVNPMYQGIEVGNRSSVPHGSEYFLTTGVTSIPQAMQAGQSALYPQQQTSAIGYHRVNAAQQHHQHLQQQQQQRQRVQQQHAQQQHAHQQMQQQQRAAQIQNAVDAPLSHWSTTPPVTARRTYAANPVYQAYTAVHDPLYGVTRSDLIYATVGGHHHHGPMPMNAGYSGIIPPSASFDGDFISEGLPPVPTAVRGSRSTANTPRAAVDTSPRIPSNRDAHSPRTSLPTGAVGDSAGAYYHDLQYIDHEMQQGISPVSWHHPSGALAAGQTSYHYRSSPPQQSTVSMQQAQRQKPGMSLGEDQGYYPPTPQHQHHRQLSTSSAIDFASAQIATSNRQQMQRRSVVGTTPVPSTANKRTVQQRGVGRRPQTPHTPQQPRTARAIMQGNTGTQPSADPSTTPRGSASVRQKSGMLLKFLDSLKASLGLASDNARTSGMSDANASPTGAFVITTPMSYENMTASAVMSHEDYPQSPAARTVVPHPSSPTPVYVPPPEPSLPLSAPFSQQPQQHPPHGNTGGSPLHPQQLHYHQHQQQQLLQQQVPQPQPQPAPATAVQRIKSVVATNNYASVPPTNSTRTTTAQQAPVMPNTVDMRGTDEKSHHITSGWEDESKENVSRSDWHIPVDNKSQGKRGAVAPPSDYHQQPAIEATTHVHEIVVSATTDRSRKFSKETVAAAAVSAVTTSATAVPATSVRHTGTSSEDNNASKIPSTLEGDAQHANAIGATTSEASPRQKAKTSEVLTGETQKDDVLQKSLEAEMKAVRQRLIRIAAAARSGPLAQPTKIVRFTWRIARTLLKLRMQAAELFSVRGVPFSSWDLRKIPTLGASPTSCRVQEMFKATIEVKNSNPLKLFVKRIPIGIWQKQYDAQNKWIGEYVTDGENFVMEAAALAFLQEYGHAVSPSLLGILEYCADSPSTTKITTPRVTRGPGGQRRSSTCNEVTHVVIVSELYGEDLLDFLDRREKEENPLSDNEKQQLQFDCLFLLRRLHYLGLAHLDFTPENVLYGSQGLRLCDFAKATPLWTYYQRHVIASSRTRQPSSTSSCSSWFPFESCEPTVGKGAYMPPECWKVYWRLEETKVQFPLEELWGLQNSEDRAAYYFRVSEADVYMIGVLMFWIWSEGGIWKCSDPRQDDKYSLLQKSRLNFDLFRECRSWPDNLKDILQRALRPEPLRRATLDDLLSHKWFAGLTPRANGTVDAPSSRQFTNTKMPDEANPATMKGLNGPKVSAVTGVVMKTTAPEERDVEPENSVGVRMKHPAVAMKGNADGGVTTAAAVLV
eukprot:Lankesteria_metandrocarpae@DN2170_c1_g1_i1.p1